MRKVTKVPLVCDNIGCESFVGYWKLFDEYRYYYESYVRRNGTFYCYQCYHFKQNELKDSVKEGKKIITFI